MPQLTPTSDGSKTRDLGPLIAPVGWRIALRGAELPAIICHTQKLGKRFEKDIG
jgi:hypothetical protein